VAVTAAVVVTSTVAWLGVGSSTEHRGTRAGRAVGARTGEARSGGASGGVSVGRAKGGREQPGLLDTVLWPGPTGLPGRGARFWRQSGSRYSDRSILRPRLGCGGSHVVWCRYIARRLSPRFFHLSGSMATNDVVELHNLGVG